MKKVDIAFYVGLVGWVFLLIGIIFNFTWSFFLGLIIFFVGWVVDYRYELYWVNFDDDTDSVPNDGSDDDSFGSDSFGNES